MIKSIKNGTHAAALKRSKTSRCSSFSADQSIVGQINPCTNNDPVTHSHNSAVYSYIHSVFFFVFLGVLLLIVSLLDY